MRNRLMLLVLVLVCLGAASCASNDTGSREFIPGSGWVPAR